MALLNRRNSAVFAKWRRYTAVLNQNLDLGRLKECWDVAYALNSAEVWQRLGAFQYNCFVFLPARHREILRVLLMAATAAMETLDIELALRIYRQQGDAAMVLGLEKVLHIEDSKLMAVRITLCFNNSHDLRIF